MSKHILPTLVAVALAVSPSGCSCGDNLSVDNTSPRGSVGGIVVDAITGDPIIGAEVVVIAGNEVTEPVLTDDIGAFGVDQVLAGDVIVQIVPPDGSTARDALVHGHLENAAGEFPAENTLTLGPIGLVPAGDDFVLRVLDATGTPVSDYQVTLRHFVEYVDFKTGVGVNSGEVVQQATTQTDGRATFGGFPDFYGLSPGVSDLVVFHLPPHAAATAFDYPGGAQTINVRELDDPTPDVILDPEFDTTLVVRASTVDQLADGLGVGTHATVININDAIHVTFNLPIRDDAQVRVTDERGSALAAAPAVTFSDDNIAINFGNDPLLPGNEYNIAIHATSAVTGLPVSADVAGSFFTAPITDAVTPVMIQKVNASETLTRIEFSEPIGIGNGATATMTGADCVVYLNFDLAGVAGPIGDQAGERGHPDCLAGSNFLYSAEPDPTGLPGPSGYTRFWEITHPDVPTGTHVDLILSRVVNPNLVIERADGRVVPNFVGTTIPLP